MKLHLFRHASVEAKYRGCYNGHIDIDASKEGLEEASVNFKKVKDIAFDKVYCSPLKRSRQTAKALDLKEEIEFSDVLREKSFGRHEGKTYDEVVFMEGESYKNFEQWIAVLDGEKQSEYKARIETLLREMSSTKNENILLICHAGFIYTMIQIVENITLKEAFLYEVKYGNYYILEAI